ncbi:MAG: symmetrical bis(5'-nucleosyl)-tetraphosphatase [Gammaproteobacteria bacterium]|nr:symmetrical bis(5'-nucleosyl)-tetraphosphatase [Pseudomonadales bacterium]MCP5347122.1 symmetrical bis(5'-nucleosyl)-tetraphosphatase [Pseudomonadales bacterium]
MTVYAIGDIQGCYKPLMKLLKQVNFLPGHDQLWCVGDLINRGPKSLDTLRFLSDIDDSVEVVLGNHDLHFLAIYHGCIEARNKDTLQKLLDAPDSSVLSEWLRHKPLAHFDSLDTSFGIQHYLMVHAGVAPQWTLQKTLDYAAEVELALQGEKFRKFLRKMYGDQPDSWSDDLTGMKRLRVITNTLTRIRFCTAEGRMDFNIKEGLAFAPPGFRPWFDFEQLTPKTNILFGHWAALEGFTGREQVHALDTGCVWGRELTMMRLEDHKLFSV